MAKVSIGAVLIAWTFTIFLAMFWYYLPDSFNPYKGLFLILALIQSAVSFRISITKKF